MALIHPEKVEDKKALQVIEKLVSGYENGSDYFVERLSEGVATIAAAFWPRPVVVRLSDFKTNGGFLSGDDRHSPTGYLSSRASNPQNTHPSSAARLSNPSKTTR